MVSSTASIDDSIYVLYANVEVNGCPFRRSTKMVHLWKNTISRGSAESKTSVLVPQ